MTPRWLKLAVEVLEVAQRGEPADRVLRETLRRQGDLDPTVRREVAERVFAVYRWWGWLGAAGDPASRLTRAWELDRRYGEHPESFTIAELREGAVPSWVWGEIDRDDDWLRFLQRRPRLWLRARRGNLGRLMQELGDCRTGPDTLPESCVYEGEQDLFLTPAFREGRMEIQDLSSQAVGAACGARPGEHWWDVCAGEGGKTVHLAEAMEGRGVVWATDRARWRLDRLKRRAARAGIFNYQSGGWDGQGDPPVDVLVDGALVDAPCSGLGTWQRNPQARWMLRPQEVGELASAQLALLRQAARKVRRGGRLVYAVCTLTRRETRGVADAFEREEREFEPWLMPGASTARSMLKPWAEGANGMFIAAWRRRKRP